jgi:hypothetical protein
VHAHNPKLLRVEFHVGGNFGFKQVVLELELSDGGWVWQLSIASIRDVLNQCQFERQLESTETKTSATIAAGNPCTRVPP